MLSIQTPSIIPQPDLQNIRRSVHLIPGFGNNKIEMEGLACEQQALACRVPDFARGAGLWARVSENCWVAVKELKLSYYIGETLLFTMYTQYGNLI